MREGYDKDDHPLSLVSFKSHKALAYWRHYFVVLPEIPKSPGPVGT